MHLNLHVPVDLAYPIEEASKWQRSSAWIVDYVQLLKDEEGDGRLRERNVSAAARGLKDVSAELGVPVPALGTAESQSSDTRGQAAPAG